MIPDTHVRMPRPDEAKEWLIRKGGLYYRSNRAGYTDDASAAGLYTKEEADREARIEPWHMFALHRSEVPGAAPPAEAEGAEGLVAELRGWKCYNCKTVFTDKMQERSTEPLEAGPNCPHCKAWGQYTYTYDLHEGDPCLHCGVPHDDVAPGPCVAAAPPAEAEGAEGLVAELRQELRILSSVAKCGCLMEPSAEALKRLHQRLHMPIVTHQDREEAQRLLRDTITAQASRLAAAEAEIAARDEIDAKASDAILKRKPIDGKPHLGDGSCEDDWSVGYREGFKEAYAEVTALRAQVERMDKALGWYERHVGGLRTPAPAIDPYLHSLNEDKGSSARAARNPEETRDGR